MPTPPLANSYWLLPGQLLAGEYPAFVGSDEANSRITSLLDAGVTFFLDLTVAGEYGMKSYDALAQEVAASRGKAIQHVRRAIGDMDVPTINEMHETQNVLRAALAQGETVYIHCFGGIGRTGTVVGCYLVESGSTGEQALAQIAALRANLPTAEHKSPETRAQRAMVMGWQ